MRTILSSFAVLALLLGGCQTNPTPEAIIYDTLQQAHNAIQAKHKLFDVEVKAGKITSTKEREVRQAYVNALTAMRTAAEAASLGWDAETPEQVDQLVASYLKLITTILPPEN